MAQPNVTRLNFAPVKSSQETYTNPQVDIYSQRMRQGLLNTGLPKAIPASWLAIIEDYCLDMSAAGRPSTTVATRRAHLARLARALNCAPADVTADKLIRWFGCQTQWKIETRRGYWNTLRGFYKWAVKHDRLPVNCAEELPQVKAQKPTPRPAPDNVWKRAIDTADGLLDRRVGVMLRLASHGLRRGEVSKVHVRDLTESPAGFLLLVHGKGNRQRIIPISDDLAAMVACGASWHTPGASNQGWMFPGDDEGHLSPKWVGTLCSRVMPDVWTMHTLRHRFATRAYKATHDIRAVQVLLGHESVATTQIYTYVDADDVRAAMLAAVA